MRRLGLAVLVLLAGRAGAARAGEVEPPAYLDDRSEAEALVRSLYNAVSRKEYARAWDYYGKAPAKDFATFSKGFAATDFVAVKTGRVASDGAAGSIYYTVPVAIAAHEGDVVRKFAGCFVVRAVNGAIQEPPNHPLRIEQARLKPASDFSIPEEVEKSCAGIAAPEDAAAALQRVKAQFAAEQRTACALGDDEVAPGTWREPEVYDLSFKFSSDEAGAKPRRYRLYQFPCQQYAYNESSVFYLEDELGEAQVVSLAEPVVDVTFADAEESRMKSWKVTGYTASTLAVNADFDVGTMTLSTFAKGRGIGDVSSAGTWVFADGEFRLVGWEYDPTADAKEDPVTIVRDGVVQPVEP